MSDNDTDNIIIDINNDNVNIKDDNDNVEIIVQHTLIEINFLDSYERRYFVLGFLTSTILLIVIILIKIFLF